MKRIHTALFGTPPLVGAGADGLARADPGVVAAVHHLHIREAVCAAASSGFEEDAKGAAALTVDEKRRADQRLPAEPAAHEDRRALVLELWVAEPAGGDGFLDGGGERGQRQVGVCARTEVSVGAGRAQRIKRAEQDRHAPAMKTRLESGMETVLSFLIASLSPESLTSMMTGLAEAMNAFVAATSRMFSAPTVAAEAPASSPKPLGWPPPPPPPIRPMHAAPVASAAPTATPVRVSALRDISVSGVSADAHRRIKRAESA